MIHSIDGIQFKRMVLHGSAALALQKQQINDLNVFPVPDGDTGTNMSLTIGTAAAELKKADTRSLGQAASITAGALLRGARGNSGVILSLLFRGMSKFLKGRDEADAAVLAAAMQEGVAAAYGAVMKPAEGTVLTVSRLASKRAAEAAGENNDVDYTLAEAVRVGYEVLAQTTDMNPVLKKAGVVDAGGKGYLVILEGMLAALRGEAMPEVAEEVHGRQEKADFNAFSAEEITFAFDTVFIVRKDDPEVNLTPLRDYLNSIGDSLVIGEDDEAFKVHVHTNTPGSALNEAQKYGVLELAKIENMRTQAEDLAAGKHVQSTDDLEAVEQELEHAPAGPVHNPPEKKFGYVAVCAGAGLEDVFRDLGVDGLVGGGQTMNPSTQDILKAIDATPAEIVYVLPNNKNIIMAAQQTIPLCEDKKVIVLPTKTVPQGISAMLSADPDASEADNTAAMMEGFDNVRTSEITYAARDSDFDGFAIHQGDYLALEEHQLFGTDQDLSAILDRLAKSDSHQSAEFISIFYGEDVTEEQAQEAERIFSQACPNAEITLLFGGQPVYYYMISAE